MIFLQNLPVVKVLEEVEQAASNDPNRPLRREIIGLVVAVDPQDAVILRYFVDANARLAIDLRSPELRSTFEVVPVTANYIADKYGIQVPRPLE